MKGLLSKMKTRLDAPIRYNLDWETPIELNDLLGNDVAMHWNGVIFCQSCSKPTKKSFGEGFCYSCFISAPEASECILRPELCRAHLGEGRDIEWEQRNHNQPHVVYFALSDKVKVGITRATQVPTRWIDQGAHRAIVLAETANRYEAGMLEVALKEFYTDKTNWQRMLKHEVDDTVDLEDEKWSLCEQLPSDFQSLFSEDDTIIELNYPVLSYPTKVSSMSFDKTPEISGKLVGIKGQYLIFENGQVFNVRKHTGYEIELKV